MSGRLTATAFAPETDVVSPIVTPSALIAVLLAAQLTIQPGSASPGDVILLTVSGVDEVPSGRLGKERLDFFESPVGYQALVGLSVEHPPGPLSVSIEGEDAAGAVVLGGSVEVRPAAFRRRTLSVAARFTNPTKQQRRHSARDQRAFREAFDLPVEPLLFEGDFEWPRQDLLAAPFGDLRLFNGQRKSQHLGVDLDGEVGDPVTAANDGEVVLVRDCFASGNTVLVHHGGQLFTAYFHLSRFAVETGEAVTRGQLLGLVGDTGRVTGPHLHFGVKLQGRWVNPASLMALRFGMPGDHRRAAGDPKGL